MTTTSSPLISLVIPTRDRPEYAALALESLKKQSFEDFEVVLSDNALHRPFDPNHPFIDGVRVRYVRPPKTAWMTDHWEFAVSQARGRYVGVLGDKSVLVAGALDRVAAEIRKSSPEAIGWLQGLFQPSGADLAGRGVVAVPRVPIADARRFSATEVLEYLLATYLNRGFSADHQLEIRGSIYHGLFSADLIRAMKERFGRVFRFYAPDLNAQCSAMQVAREVMQIGRPLELVMAGPSNGVAVGLRAAQILGTQEESARGGSGTTPRLIPGVTVSIAHLLACDLLHITGRTLDTEQWRELYRRVAVDLYRIRDWPDRELERSEWAALRSSAASFGPAFVAGLRREKSNARRGNVRAWIAEQLHKRLGPRAESLRRVVGSQESGLERRQFDRLSAALEGTT